MTTVRSAAMTAVLLSVAGADAFATNASSAGVKSASCATAPFHRFDFWLGAWNVTNAAGKVAGHSRIETILGGCAIAEHWEGAGGSNGVSYNAYDATAKTWRQFWVDNQGNVLRLEGDLADNRMILQSTTSAHVDRITWTPNPDGSVRQFWEASEDSGKTWSSSFDGTYRRAR